MSNKGVAREKSGVTHAARSWLVYSVVNGPDGRRAMDESSRRGERSGLGLCPARQCGALVVVQREKPQPRNIVGAPDQLSIQSDVGNRAGNPETHHEHLTFADLAGYTNPHTVNAQVECGSGKRLPALEQRDGEADGMALGLAAFVRHLRRHSRAYLSSILLCPQRPRRAEGCAGGPSRGCDEPRPQNPATATTPTRRKLRIARTVIAVPTSREMISARIRARELFTTARPISSTSDSFDSSTLCCLGPPDYQHVFSVPERHLLSSLSLTLWIFTGSYMSAKLLIPLRELAQIFLDTV